MSEIEERLNDLDSKLSTVDREFHNSWASGSRSEYEERFRTHIVNRISARFWLFFSGSIAVLGTAIFLYIGNAIETKVNIKVNEKIAIEREKESSRLEAIIAEFDWRQSHDFGYVYRNLAKVFWEDKTIDPEHKKRWISQVLYLATEKLEKAEEKKSSKGATYWELGNLAYILPLKYQTGTEDPHKAEIYFENSVSLYTKSEVSKGWRGGAYEDLAIVQMALAKLHEGNAKEVEYRTKSKVSKQLALRDYKELVSKSLSWRNASIIRLENEIKSY